MQKQQAQLTASVITKKQPIRTKAIQPQEVILSKIQLPDVYALRTYFMESEEFYEPIFM